MGAVRFIAVGKRLTAVVDAADFRALAKFRWQPYVTNRYGRIYAGRRVRANTPCGFTTVYMHKLLIDAPLVDHKNGNTLDNRRSNLRVASAAQSAQNTRKQARGSKSSFKGAYFNRQTGKWFSRIQVNKRSHYLGAFATDVQAACAYDTAARKHYGRFAALSFPRRGERSALS